MNPVIISEAVKLIFEKGDALACAEVLDALDTALGPHSVVAEIVRRARNELRQHATSYPVRDLLYEAHKPAVASSWEALCMQVNANLPDPRD